MDKTESAARKAIKTMETGESTRLFTTYEVAELIRLLDESRKNEAGKQMQRVERKLEILFKLLDWQWGSPPTISISSKGTR